MKNKIFILLTIFLAMFLAISVVPVKAVDPCVSLKDKDDDWKAGSKDGDGNPLAYKWISWEDFCSKCPSEQCCGKNKTCDCSCEAKYCAKDAVDGKMKCLTYAKSCSCYGESSRFMVAGRDPWGGLVTSYGSTFGQQCQQFWTAAGDKACFADRDCVSCPSSKPNYPSSKCDYKNKKCVWSDECGASECSTDGQCCGKAGEENPHYECSSDYKCSLVKTCGKSQCSPKDDFLYKSAGWDSWQNKTCKKFSCDISKRQCIWDITGIYGADDYSKCSTFCAKGITPLPTTTTTTTTTKGRSPITTTTITTLRTGGPGGTTTTTIRPIIITTTTIAPYFPSSCRVRDFYWTKYSDSGIFKEQYQSYVLLGQPDDYILDNPLLEYFVSDCNTCNLSIVPTGTTSIPTAFINDSRNSGVFGSQNPTSGSRPKYTFDRTRFGDEGIPLYTKELIGVGQYDIILKCAGADPEDVSSKTIKLRTFPYFRWREVTPVLNK